MSGPDLLESTKSATRYGVTVVSIPGQGVDVIMPAVRECLTPGEARQVAAMITEGAEFAEIKFTSSKEVAHA